MRLRAIGVALFLVARAQAAPVTEVLTDRDIANAYNIANGSDATRTIFHAAYRIPAADLTIEQFEVITEFRRFVLAAEEAMKSGNWMMARGGMDAKGRSLKDHLRSLAGQVSIRARVRFHPLNSYTTPPPLDILVGEPTLLALNAVRTPHVTTGEPGARDVITGATIETFVNAPTIADRPLPVRLVFEGKELARAEVDFSRID